MKKTISFFFYVTPLEPMKAPLCFVKEKDIQLPIGTIFQPLKDVSFFNGGIVKDYSYYERDNELIMNVEATIDENLTPYLEEKMLLAGYTRNM